MKTINRVMGVVKVVGGMGMMASAVMATGALVWLAPVCGIGAGLMMASGCVQVITGKAE